MDRPVGRPGAEVILGVRILVLHGKLIINIDGYPFLIGPEIISVNSLEIV